MSKAFFCTTVFISSFALAMQKDIEMTDFEAIAKSDVRHFEPTRVDVAADAGPVPSAISHEEYDELVGFTDGDEIPGDAQQYMRPQEQSDDGPISWSKKKLFFVSILGGATSANTIVSSVFGLQSIFSSSPWIEPSWGAVVWMGSSIVLNALGVVPLAYRFCRG